MKVKTWRKSLVSSREAQPGSCTAFASSTGTNLVKDKISILQAGTALETVF